MPSEGFAAKQNERWPPQCVQAAKVDSSAFADIDPSWRGGGPPRQSGIGHARARLRRRSSALLALTAPTQSGRNPREAPLLSREGAGLRVQRRAGSEIAGTCAIGGDPPMRRPWSKSRCNRPPRAPRSLVPAFADRQGVMPRHRFRLRRCARRNRRTERNHCCLTPFSLQAASDLPSPTVSQGRDTVRCFGRPVLSPRPVTAA